MVDYIGFGGDFSRHSVAYSYRDEHMYEVVDRDVDGAIFGEME